MSVMARRRQKAELARKNARSVPVQAPEAPENTSGDQDASVPDNPGEEEKKWPSQKSKRTK